MALVADSPGPGRHLAALADSPAGPGPAVDSLGLAAGDIHLPRVHSFQSV